CFDKNAPSTSSGKASSQRGGLFTHGMFLAFEVKAVSFFTPPVPGDGTHNCCIGPVRTVQICSIPSCSSYHCNDRPTIQTPGDAAHTSSRTPESPGSP